MDGAALISTDPGERFEGEKLGALCLFACLGFMGLGFGGFTLQGLGFMLLAIEMFRIQRCCCLVRVVLLLLLQFRVWVKSNRKM